MSDIFDIFEHMSHEEENLDEQINQFQEHDDENILSVTGEELYTNKHSEDSSELDKLLLSNEELHMLDSVKEQKPDVDSEEKHQVLLGETISCSDCSGSCAAYCASMWD